MSRKKARDCAFKLIFEIPFHENEYETRLNYYANTYDEDDLNKKDIEYINFTVKKCFENVENIDAKIQKNLRGWTVSRLAKTTVAILRLAICEIEFCDDVPFQVAINEAVELAKIYGNDEDPSFINGVLANIVK
ncbi:MAG: transcription antitermination factor NusB [Ruminococcaceae bacterium]|nr:transcription antitermination factor NusB [Oscillospiraceae bacterium]